MDGDFWLRAGGLVALMVGLFAYPVVTLIRDERRTARAATEGDQTEPVPAEHSA